MNVDNNEQQPTGGLISAGGFVSHPDSINTITIEYAGYSLIELRALLEKNVKLELYEKCAAIRDEIYRREQ